MEYFAIGSDLLMGAGSTVASPSTITSIGCVIDVTPNTVSRTFNEVRPCLNSTDRTVKKKPGQVDYGVFFVTLRFSDTQYDAILALLVAGTKKPVFEKLGDTGKALGAMVYVESLGVPQLVEDGEVQMTVSFMIDSEFDLVTAPTVGGGS